MSDQLRNALDEVGGEPLAGSEFEDETPEPEFSASEVSDEWSWRKDSGSQSLLHQRVDSDFRFSATATFLDPSQSLLHQRVDSDEQKTPRRSLDLQKVSIASSSASRFRLLGG